MARKMDNADMFLAFQAFMEQQGFSGNPAHGTVTAKAPRTLKQANQDAAKAKAKAPRGTNAATLNAAARPKGTRPTRVTPKAVITCQDAWIALGSDPTFAPSNPNAPARNAQLWRLNDMGKLAIR